MHRPLLHALAASILLGVPGLATAQAAGAVAPPATAMPARAEAPRLPRGYATPSEEQRAQLATALKKSVPNGPIKALADEAAPVIGMFVERLACLSHSSGASALNEFGAPGTHVGSSYTHGHPMAKTRYHHKGTCMTVTRVHGWMAPAANALRFEAVFKADDSGEAVSTKHELVKQPDGDWLFTR